MASDSVLLDRHSELERRIAEEMKRPLPDSAMLRTLKVQKLKIKEALNRF